jgi:hypothetical protein
VGGVLGVLDGLTAWFTPEARPMLFSIVTGSTVKGLLAGLLIGLFARKIGRMGWTLAFATALGALLAFGVAFAGGKYYLEIVLPGTFVGLLTGYATLRYGRAPAKAS